MFSIPTFTGSIPSSVPNIHQLLVFQIFTVGRQFDIASHNVIIIKPYNLYYNVACYIFICFPIGSHMAVQWTEIFCFYIFSFHFYFKWNCRTFLVGIYDFCRLYWSTSFTNHEGVEVCKMDKKKNELGSIFIFFSIWL